MNGLFSGGFNWQWFYFFDSIILTRRIFNGQEEFLMDKRKFNGRGKESLDEKIGRNY